MKKIPVICFIAIVCFSVQIFGQVSEDKQPVQVFIDKQALKRTFVRIVKAEDERRFDEVLEGIIEKGNPIERKRAALAAGRIGDEAAIPILIKLLENDSSADVREMAAFALGEIESIKGADAILKVMNNRAFPDKIRARAVEAGGKVAAANAADERSKLLGAAILNALETEDKLGEKQSKDVILLGITAALRAKADETDFVVGKFLTNLDARIRADAANALARLRTKNFNEKFRSMLLTDDDANARANAARGLGVGEDKESLDLLITAAVSDEDSRVRVSAIRSLGNLKDEKSAEKLLERGEKLLADYKKSKSANPSEKSELLEIATALGNIFKGKDNEKALIFLQNFRQADSFRSPETEIAFARISPEKYIKEFNNQNKGLSDWRVSAAYAQGFAEIGNSQNDEIRALAGQTFTAYIGTMQTKVKPAYQVEMIKAMPDLIRGMAALKPDNLTEILRSMVDNSDVFIRATAAEILGEQPAKKENIEALKKAFDKSLLTDKKYNDAQLVILGSLYKLDKKESVGTLLLALNAPDYLVRKKAFDLLQDKELQSDFPGIPTSLENAVAKKKNQVLPYASAFGTKLGQILNTEADYTRAVSRENGKVQAVLTTEKGKFTIELLPEDAPLTVDNFIKLARSRYFNGLAVHRVVPNFVMQDGDPRGDGNGGPGYSIRCEINTVPYERGAVGMALSGKDTGGSQWFVTHSPQPHLDGGYTVFGRVNEDDIKIVDSIVRGDKILKVEIIEKK